MVEASVTLKEGKGAKWYLSWEALVKKFQEKGDLRPEDEVIGVKLTEKGIEFRTAEKES